MTKPETCGHKGEISFSLLFHYPSFLCMMCVEHVVAGCIDVKKTKKKANKNNEGNTKLKKKHKAKNTKGGRGR